MSARRRNDRQTAFRLPSELITRLDAHATFLRLTTGMNVTRSDVVRLLLNRALEPHEAKIERAAPRSQETD